MDIAEHYRKTDVSGNSIVYYGRSQDSYEMDFVKDDFILVKLDEMYNILKSASHCLFVGR